jgi:hypothetical protein
METCYDQRSYLITSYHDCDWYVVHVGHVNFMCIQEAMSDNYDLRKL